MSLCLNYVYYITDGDYIYTVPTPPAPTTHAPLRTGSAVARRPSESALASLASVMHPQSKTLPRALYHTESLFSRDVPQGMLILTTLIQC